MLVYSFTPAGSCITLGAYALPSERFSNMRLLSYSVLMVFTLCFCNSRHPGNDEKSSQRCAHGKWQEVQFALADSISVTYALDSAFIRVPNALLGLENWNVKALRKYIRNADTVTIEWFNNYGKFDDTTGISMLGRDLGRKIHGAHAPPLPTYELCPKLLEYYGVQGVSSKVRLQDRYMMMCYGVNHPTDVLVCVTYSSASNSGDPENVFFCMLESMRFSKSD